MAEPAGDGAIEETEDQIPEKKPLLSKNGSTESEDANRKTESRRQKGQQKIHVDGTGSSVRYKCLWGLFYTLCFISGQYINFEILKIPCSLTSSPKSSRKNSQSSTKKFFSVIAVIPFVIKVIVCVGYVATALFVDGLTVANASLPKTIAFHSNRNDCNLPEEHWKFTTAVSISSVAAIFSYGLMTVFILIFANIIQCASHKYRSKEEGSTGCHQTTRSDALSEYSSTEEDSRKEGLREHGTRDRDREQGSKDRDREPTRDRDREPGTETENQGPRQRTRDREPGTETGNKEPGTETENKEPGTETENKEPGTVTEKKEPGTATENKKPRAKTEKKEPGTETETEKKEPGTETENKEPETETENKEPGTETEKKEPGTETESKEPETETENKEPGTETEKKEPGTETEKKEPGTETEKKEPGTGTETEKKEQGARNRDREQGKRDQDSKTQNSRKQSNKGSCSEYIQKLWDSDLSPYNDTSNNDMSAKETAYFFINYSVLLVLFLCSCVTMSVLFTTT